MTKSRKKSIVNKVRNFVAKNAKISGSGYHKDKKHDFKLNKAKHKKLGDLE